jgi:hypothetical protein
MKRIISKLTMISFALGLVIWANGPASAQKEHSLGEKSQNPIGNLISMPFENDVNGGVGALNRTQDVILFKPVVPVSLGPDWNLIARGIVPAIYKPAYAAGDSEEFGLGDIQLQTFFVPKKVVPIPGGSLIWGIGPEFQFKTAGDPQLGTGKWSAGANGVVFVATKPWTFGALVSNIWSFAGDSKRADVNMFTLQPFLNYNMEEGWYLTSSPIITANWEASSNNRWTIPLGGGLGRVFKVGDQPVNAQIQAFGYADTPEGGSDWTIRTEWTFLFPE